MATPFQIRPIPDRPKVKMLGDRLEHRTDLTPTERRVRLVLDKALSAVSACKCGNEIHADTRAFADLVGKVFDALWDSGENT